MPKIRRKNKQPVRLTWLDVQKATHSFFLWLWSFLYLVRYLDPRRYLPSASWSLTTKFTLDPQDGSIVYQPSIWEQMVQALRPVATNKHKLLEWIQKQIPSLRVVNLSSSWSDGVALCALMEALCPGACPRYDLLKPHHKVNNCRLGLKLAHKYLGIPQNIISAEEIALNNTNRERKILRMLSLIKWAATQRQQIETKSGFDVSQRERRPSSAIKRQCTAKGSGLIVGLINKRSKFDLHTPPNELLNIRIEITGPKGESCNEHILSLFPNKRMTAPSPSSEFIGEDRAVELWQTGTSKLLGSESPLQIVHHREHGTTSENVSDALKVPFDYKCICEGHIQVSYVPRNEGVYVVGIQWQGLHIKGSPFQVTVADTIDNLNKCNKGKMHQSTVSHPPAAQENKLPEVVFEGITTGITETPTESNFAEEEEADPPTGITAAVLNRTSKVQRSISNSSLLGNKITKQATVTRRRILKRVITSAGQEIVIQMAPPTPCPSQDSEDKASVNGRDSPCEGNADSNSKKKRKENERSFDFEIWYDSDTSYTSSNNSRCVSPDRHDIPPPSKELHVYAYSILEAVLQDVYRIAERKQREEMLALKESECNRNAASRSSPSNENLSPSSLKPPNFDIKFKCSPFTNGTEALKKYGKSDSEDSEAPLTATDEIILSDPIMQDGLAKLNEMIKESMIQVDVTSSESNSGDHKSSLEDKLQQRTQRRDYTKNMMSDTESSLTSALETDSDSLPRWTANRNRKTSKRVPEVTVFNNGNNKVTVKTQMKLPVNQLPKELQEPVNILTPSISREEKIHTVKKINNSLSVKADHPQPEQYEPKEPAKEKEIAVPKSRSVEGKKKAPTNTHRESPLSSCMDVDDFNYTLDVHINDHTAYSLMSPKMGLRLSTSLPSLSKNWTAFEIDEDSDLTIEEMEALSVAIQKQPKRATLGGADLAEVLKEVNSLNANSEPETNLSSGAHLRYKLISNIPAKSDAEKAENQPHTLGIDTPSPKYLSPRVSPLSMNSSRGSFRVDAQSCSTKTEEDSESNVIQDRKKCLSEAKHGVWEALPPKVPVICTMETLQLPSSHPASPKGRAGIKVPKATMDRNIQVSYDDIKCETGWKRPAQYVRPRRHILRSDPVDISSSSADSNSVERNSIDSESTNKPNVPRIVCNLDSNDVSPPARNEAPAKQGPGYSPSMENGNLLGVDALQQPQRQSTVDTVDSGIVDDNSASPRQSAPTSPLLACAMALRPKFINGHRAVTRNSYKGKMTLDPRLTSATTPTTPTTPVEDDHLFNVSSRGWSSILFTRSNSRLRRSEISEDVGKCDSRPGIRRRSSFRSGGCYKRRVTFSRRVMLHQRSSSHSSKNSRSRDSSSTEQASQDQGRASLDIQTKANQKRMLFNLNGRGDEITGSPQHSLVSPVKELDIASFRFKPMGAENAGLLKTAENSRPSSGFASDVSSSPGGSGAPAQSIEPNAKPSPKQSPTTVNPAGPREPHESEDSFDGFGVTKITRKQLLDELASFSQLTCVPGPSSRTRTSSTEQNKPMSNQSSLDLSNKTDDVFESDCSSEVARLTGGGDIGQNPEIQWANTSANSVDIPCNIDQSNPEASLDFLSNFEGAGPLVDDTEVSEAELQKMLTSLDIENEPSEPEMDDLLAGNSAVPDPFRCKAMGSGLHVGKLQVKNNFQVITKTAGNGSLNVSIAGPRPKTVKETTVVYTGDDLYEVLFEVTQPGYYVINVKWSDYHIPESPFICNVSY